MGRDKKLGIEACPKCGNLGWRYKKKVRGRTGQRYIRRSYFLHNDRRIQECYIDNFTRPKQITPLQEFQDGLSNFGHVIRVTCERLTELPLDDKELEELWSSLKWADFNICLPLEVLKKVYTGKLKVPQDEVKRLENTILKNINSRKNLFGNGFKFSSFHHNIMVPYNINRRKAINQKLRDSYNFPRPTLPNLINPDSRYIT